MGDENDDVENGVDDVDGPAYAKKCKEVARLLAQIYEVQAAFGDTEDTATRT